MHEQNFLPILQTFCKTSGTPAILSKDTEKNTIGIVKNEKLLKIKMHEQNFLPTLQTFRKRDPCNIK